MSHRAKTRPNSGRRRRLSLAGDRAQQPLTADQASFIKNRCQLRTEDEPGFYYLDYGIDERHHEPAPAIAFAAVHGGLSNEYERAA